MQFKDILLAVLITFVWGLNFIAVKWAVVDFPPLTANSIRFLIVFLAFSPFFKFVKGHMKTLLLAAFTLGVLHFGFVFWGMKLSGGVGAVAIASQLAVPFSTLLAIIFLKESVGWKRILGIGISFGGVMVLGFDPSVFSYIDGLLVIVGAAFLYAVSAIFMRSLKDIPAVTTQAWVGLAGTIGSLALSLMFESEQVDAVYNASTLAWGGVIYSAVGSSIIGHGLANYLFTKYEVSVVSPYFLLMPMFAIASGVIILDETITGRMLIGGALTIAGVLIVTLRNKQKRADIATTVDD